MIGGKELAFADDGSSTLNVSLLVQIPASFNPGQPCIVTATSSGSRGVYGAISAAGEWGLKRGCAVAYTDKGSGNSVHELGRTPFAHRRYVVQRRRCRQDQRVHGEPREHQSCRVQRAIPESLRVQARPLAAEPGEIAYWALNDTYGLLDGTTRKIRYNRGDVTTIAASVSNGGGASLAAAEQDTQGWIMAVVGG